MVAEDRIARLESDVCELKGDVKALDARVTESIITNAKEYGALRADMEKGFGALKTEMEKGFGTLRTEIEKNRADTEKSFGLLRTEIEKNRADTEKNFGLLRTEIEENRADTEKSFGSLKASIESAKLWMLVTGVGSVILVTFLTFLGHALKLL